MDVGGGKRTWVHWVGPARSYLVYLVLGAAAFAVIWQCFAGGLLGYWALASYGALPMVLGAVAVMRRSYRDKKRLMVSSRLAILAQSVAGSAIALDLLL
jgi:hypothetical protein